MSTQYFKLELIIKNVQGIDPETCLWKAYTYEVLSQCIPPCRQLLDLYKICSPQGRHPSNGLLHLLIGKYVL